MSFDREQNWNMRRGFQSGILVLAVGVLLPWRGAYGQQSTHLPVPPSPSSQVRELLNQAQTFGPAKLTSAIDAAVAAGDAAGEALARDLRAHYLEQAKSANAALEELQRAEAAWVRAGYYP